MLLLLTLPITIFALIGPDFIKFYESGPTQFMTFLSLKGPSTDRVSYKQQLSPANQQIVRNFLAENPNTDHAELGENYYNILHVDRTFENIYNHNKTLTMTLFRNQTYKKADILSQIGERFNDSNYIHTILYMTGQAQRYNGGLIIAQKDEIAPENKWDFLIVYRDISELWRNRTNKLRPRHLHLILEHSYSGLWAKQCYEDVDFLDISISASCQITDKSHDIGIGSYYTYNLMQSIRPFQISKFIIQDTINSRQNISTLGFGMLLNNKFGLRIYYNNWQEIFQYVNKTIDELY